MLTILQQYTRKPNATSFRDDETTERLNTKEIALKKGLELIWLPVRRSLRRLLANKNSNNDSSVTRTAIQGVIQSHSQDGCNAVVDVGNVALCDGSITGMDSTLQPTRPNGRRPRVTRGSKDLSSTETPAPNQTRRQLQDIGNVALCDGSITGMDSTLQPTRPNVRRPRVTHGSSDLSSTETPAPKQTRRQLQDIGNVALCDGSIKGMDSTLQPTRPNGRRPCVTHGSNELSSTETPAPKRARRQLQDIKKTRAHVRTDIQANRAQEKNKRNSKITETQFSHGNFDHGYIDGEGGTLEVPGVKMEIPKGALQESTLITVGITWENDNKPHLSRKQALLSPVVVCEPSGQQFLVPVKITMTHCAENVKQNWNTQLKTCEEEISQASNWSNVKESNDGEIVVGDHEVTFFAKHFTKYVLTGVARGGQACFKFVRLMTYASILEVAAFFKVRVYCVDSFHDKKQVQHVFESEYLLDGRKACSDGTVRFENNSKNMLILVEQLSEGWELRGSKKEEMEFESVWQSQVPSCTFIFDPIDEQSNAILCNLMALQNGSNVTRLLKIAYNAAQVVRSETTDVGRTNMNRTYHAKMVFALGEIIHPTSQIFEDMKCFVDRNYLQPTACHLIVSFHMLMAALEKAGHIEPGKYGTLKKILKDVNCLDKEIMDIIATCTTAYKGLDMMPPSLRRSGLRPRASGNSIDVSSTVKTSSKRARRQLQGRVSKSD